MQVSEAISRSPSDDVPPSSGALDISDATSGPCGGAAERRNTCKVQSSLSIVILDKSHTGTCDWIGEVGADRLGSCASRQ